MIVPACGGGCKLAVVGTALGICIRKRDIYRITITHSRAGSSERLEEQQSLVYLIYFCDSIGISGLLN